MNEPRKLVPRWELLLAATADPRLTKADSAVLGQILDHMFDGQSARPGYARIAQRAAVDRRSVSRAIGRLCDAGYLRRTSGGIRNGKRVPNTYHLGAPTRDTAAPSDSPAPRDTRASRLGTRVSPRLGAHVPPEAVPLKQQKEARSPSHATRRPTLVSSFEAEAAFHDDRERNAGW